MIFHSSLHRSRGRSRSQGDCGGGKRGHYLRIGCESFIQIILSISSCCWWIALTSLHRDQISWLSFV
jgi:hypothetical protein